MDAFAPGYLAGVRVQNHSLEARVAGALGGFRRGPGATPGVVASARYERGSILLTSNTGFAEWGEVLGDPVIATAILDRLLHHSHVLGIRGESYRLREKKQAGLLGVSLVPGPTAGPSEEDATPFTHRGVGQSSAGDSGSRVRRR